MNTKDRKPRGTVPLKHAGLQGVPTHFDILPQGGRIYQLIENLLNCIEQNSSQKFPRADLNFPSYQGCGSALIFCGSGSSRFSECGSGSSCFKNADPDPDPALKNV